MELFLEKFPKNIPRNIRELNVNIFIPENRILRKKMFIAMTKMYRITYRQIPVYLYLYLDKSIETSSMSYFDNFILLLS